MGEAALGSWSLCRTGHGRGAVGVGLNEDTLGGILKASLSQYLALEIAKGNGKDSRYDVRSWRLCGRSVLTSPHCLALEVPQSRAISYY